ncbi:FadR family transcriptional regulator [Azospirillum sp. RWY-5-1]|uniref:FadR family transcriptional regulator n=1 Tax=Azospirillum oleiclasticum TaxID=2735135 RepID=A0ABX2TG26_9PROT|nr:FadR/GntR family transcriptional regulator [Azospirillum oleiclasticum]NYZ14354.1 FadR family transcriptional regulator [Azospirillum oleiclasticum]NYZ23294.1 FadR family transcriptional regulator [Azospirillum oleiclasticum]
MAEPIATDDTLDDDRSGGARARQSPLAQRVYQLLLTMINAGDYQPDQKLPGEHELASQFLVSRPIVREALGRLRDEGLIYSRQGAGSFVKKRGNGSRVLGYAPVETIADIQRCYEFRLTIEPDHAYFAALRWNDPALDAIAAALELMHDATKAHLHREDADYAFHCAVAHATNNHYYTASMLALKDHIAVGMKFHGVSLMGPKSGLAGVFEEHKGIFEAIRHRDAEAARDLMRRHLEGSRDRIFEGKVLDLSL